MTAHDTTFAEVLANLMEEVSPLIEAVAGYSARLVAAGFDPEIAQAMAADLHAEIVPALFRGQAAQ